MSTVISSLGSPNIRSCIPYAPELNIAIRANGESPVSFIDIAGNIYPAGIPEPTAAPVFVSEAATANTLANGWYCWRYVYAAGSRYPYLDAGVAVNGSIAPRGNPSGFLTREITAGPKTVTMNLQQADRQDIDTIFVFRTVVATTQAAAELQASSGLMYYVGEITTGVFGTGTVPFTDNVTTPNTSLGQIEFDNFFAPQARYAIYEPPYFWLFGNDPLVQDVVVEDDIVNLTSESFKFYGGRDGQLATVSTIITGGIDGRGTFIWKQLSSNTGVLTLDGETPETLDDTVGILKITGPSTTLYRSKANNPLSWGETTTFGTVRSSQIFAVKVGGGIGTAIAVFPGGEILKLDTKYPSKSYSYNLRIAPFPEFPQSKRIISDYSVSSHFSQFVAIASDHLRVLWGFDVDSFAILQCDGTTQRPISERVQKSLQDIDTDPVRLQFAHGLSHESTKLNIMWLPCRGKTNPEITEGEGEAAVIGRDVLMNWTDLQVIYHFLSDTWSTGLDFDRTCSASVQNVNDNRTEIVGGTDTGIIDRIYNEWYDSDPADRIGYYAYQKLFPTTQDVETEIPFLDFSDTITNGNDLVGVWLQLRANVTEIEGREKFDTWLRASNIEGSRIYFDRVIRNDLVNQHFSVIWDYIHSPDSYGVDETDITNPVWRCTFGGIPNCAYRYLKADTVTRPDKIESVYLVGKSLEEARFYFLTPNFRPNSLQICNQTVPDEDILGSQVWFLRDMSIPFTKSIIIRVCLEGYSASVQNASDIENLWEQYPPYFRGLGLKFKQ